MFIIFAVEHLLVLVKFLLLQIILDNLSIFEIQSYIVNMNDGDPIDYDLLTGGSMHEGRSKLRWVGTSYCRAIQAAPLEPIMARYKPKMIKI